MINNVTRGANAMELLYALWDLAVPIMLVIIVRLLQDRSDLRAHNDWLRSKVDMLRDENRDTARRMRIAYALHDDTQQLLDDARAQLAQAHAINSDSGDMNAVADSRLGYAEAEIAQLQADNFQLRLHLLQQGVNRYITVHTN